MRIKLPCRFQDVYFWFIFQEVLSTFIGVIVVVVIQQNKVLVLFEVGLEKKKK